MEKQTISTEQIAPETPSEPIPQPPAPDIGDNTGAGFPCEQPQGEPPFSQMTTEEAVILAQEADKALRDIGEEQLEPPAPFDIGGGHIPDHKECAVIDKLDRATSAAYGHRASRSSIIL